MNPRDTIAAILKVRDENVLPSEVDDNERDASADYILSALTAAGHIIVGPADMEKAVEAAKDAYDASIEMQPREYHQAWFEAITAAATHMPVPAGWQPIETAPKDGTLILVSFGGKGVRAVSWDSPWSDATPEDGIWCVDDDKNGPFPLRGYSDEGYNSPTHWMSLPAAPKPAALTQEPKP